MVCEGGTFFTNEARAVCTELGFDPSQSSTISTSIGIDFLTKLKSALDRILIYVYVM